MNTVFQAPARKFGFAVLLVFCFALSACTEIQLASHLYKQASPPNQGSFKVGNPYKISGRTYYPEERYDLVETGIASWYGPQFHGKLTANGETFDMDELTAAHKTLQMPSIVRVTNLENGRSLIVRVNDRGPYKKNRVIDMSRRSAELLGFKNKGTAKVRVEVLDSESRQVAAVAKSGRSTRGIELALNQGRQPDAFKTLQPATRTAVASADTSPSTAAAPSSATSTTTRVKSASTVAEAPRTPVTSSPVNAAYNTPVQSEPLSAPAQAKTAANTQPQPAALTSEGPGGVKNVIPGHTKNGNFYPDQVVMEVPVEPTSIFVQAGSFSNETNAARLARSLSQYAKADVYPALVNGQQYYRVRLGPIADVEGADALVATLDRIGNNAIIVVD